MTPKTPAPSAPSPFAHHPLMDASVRLFGDGDPRLRCDQPGCTLPAVGESQDRIRFCGRHFHWSKTNLVDAADLRTTADYRARSPG